MIGPLLALFAAQAAAPAAAPPACTFDNAVPADVREMAAAPEQWLDRCVRLDGYVWYNHFYEDAGGYYRYFSRNYADRRNDGWLGLYPNGVYGFDGPMRRGSVVGIVHDCETDQARGEAEDEGIIIMMTGFCHYRYGLVLQRVTYRPGSRADFTRQVGDEARLRFGDLEAEDEAGSAPPQVRALADRFVGALRSGDAEAVRALVEVSRGGEENADRLISPEEIAIYRRGERGAALSPLGGAGPAPQMAFFRERAPEGLYDEGSDEGVWHACFCRVANCSGLWPIARDDADGDPARPYLCLGAYPARRNAPAEKLILIRLGGLPEPASSTFRR